MSILAGCFVLWVLITFIHQGWIAYLNFLADEFLGKKKPQTKSDRADAAKPLGSKRD